MYRVLVGLLLFCSLAAAANDPEPKPEPKPQPAPQLHLDITLSINDEIVSSPQITAREGTPFVISNQDLDIEMVPTLPKKDHLHLQVEISQTVDGLKSVLSKPQITTTMNQSATLAIGQENNSGNSLVMTVTPSMK